MTEVTVPARTKRPPIELRHLPKIWLDALEQQCGGDWRRVYLDADGVPMVGNMAREELAPAGPTARKMRQHAAPRNGAHRQPPTPTVMAGTKAPPRPRGLRPPPEPAPPPTPPESPASAPMDAAREAPAPPPPPPAVCEICGLVGAHRRSCYNGLVAFSGAAPPAEPEEAPGPPPVDESQLALDLNAGELSVPEDVATPEPTLTSTVITTTPATRPVFQPPSQPPREASITINGRDIEDLPLRELQDEREPRRYGRRVVTDDTGTEWVLLEGIHGEADWDGMDVIGTAVQVWNKLREGLPPEAPMYWHDDVTSLNGVDLDMVESVARQPARVEIAPETAVKKFPVLRFWRGDVCTVVGFRVPNMPLVIAAYVSARAFNEYLGKGGQDQRTGGGGSRKSVGVPRRPRTLAKRLREMGAEIKEVTDDKTGTITATVTYKGEEIGKYRVHPCTPGQIENDWQRIQRQISVRWQRELAGKM